MQIERNFFNGGEANNRGRNYSETNNPKNQRKSSN